MMNHITNYLSNEEGSCKRCLKDDVYSTTSGSTKCTSKDERNTFDSCAMDYRNMALWCDYTNFTGILNPEDIESEAPCNRAMYLYFNDSCLQNINSTTLQKYTFLKLADFSENQLNEINDTTFSNVSLEVLDLSKNNISDITAKAFSSLLRLEKLRLAGNNLSLLPIHIFKKLTKLQILEIDNNLLATLSEQLFPKHSSLKKLNVENNKLRKFFMPQRRQFVLLETINADRNQIQVLTRRNFAHLNNLRNINFGNNDLSEVENGVFDHSIHLKTVDLRNNKLRFLPKDLLSKHCELQAVILSGNSLTTINPSFFAIAMYHEQTIPSVQLEFDLRNNSWSCDCDMFDYWKFLQILFENKTSSRFDLNIKCYSPEEWRGSDFMGNSALYRSRCMTENNSVSSEVTDIEFFVPKQCKKRKLSHHKSFKLEPNLGYYNPATPGSAVNNFPRMKLIVSLLLMIFYFQ